MTDKIVLKEIKDSLPYFNVIQTGILIIDQQCQVVLANETSSQILGLAEINPDHPVYCHHVFYEKSTPCDDCAVIGGKTPLPKQKSITVKRNGGKDMYLKVFYSQLGEYALLTIHDVTREVTLLREITYTWKEQQAKNVIIERKRQETDQERKVLEQMLDHLPEALVMVGPDFSIQRKNRAVGKILSANDAAKCYEIFNHDQPCPRCPAQDGFKSASGKKRSHSVEHRFFTEFISDSPVGVGGILQFRDTTRQIKLIEQIREQQETITRKNEILSGLVSFGAFMQKEPEPMAVIEFFLDIFGPLIKARQTVVLVSDIRPGNLWFTVKKNIEEEQIIKLNRAFLEREIQSSKNSMIPEADIPWENSTQISLIGGNGERVGIVLFEGEYDAEYEELIKLYTEPLGAYVHNKLLLRRLEEKANTDPLTGLYNRGYLDQALFEEQKKLAQYKIDYSLVVVDVNRLKMANDLYGHEAGDKLIVTVSDILRQEVRSTDIVARTGGDEFLILLTNTKSKGAEKLITRLKAGAFFENFMDVGQNEKFPVTVSLGAAGTDQLPPEDLVKEADQRMYADKEEYYKTQKKYR